MAAIRFLLRLLALILAVFLLFPIIIALISLSLKLNKPNMNRKVVAFWSIVLCYVCGLKLKMRGEIQKNPVLIVANHVSWLDIPAIHCFKLAGFVAKQEIAHWPFLGWAIKQGETLFIKRGKQESRKEVLLSIQQRLQQGRSIAIFPEGKATNGDSLGNFHRQLMQAAIETQTPVQAIAIKYFDNQGKRNRVVCFKNNENFLVNVLRIISLPTSTVELTFCSTVQTQTRTAREVALITHNQVAQVLAENDYL